MADKADAMFSFISSTLRRNGGRNMRSLTYPHNKASHGVISGDLRVRIFLNNSVLHMVRLRDIYGTLIENLNGRGVLVHLGTSTRK